jgi:hypothetical protein
VISYVRPGIVGNLVCHIIPTCQHTCMQARNSTVYTVRIETGTDRAAGLDNNNSGVQLCMIGQKNNALLHRICQLEPPADSEDTMAEICKVRLLTFQRCADIVGHCRLGTWHPRTTAAGIQIVGSEGGAACDSLPTKTAPGFSAPQVIKRRFQRSSIDEVSFAGPDLGPLAAILAGPEEGAWQLSEVIVANSRQMLTQRFICRERLGREGGSGAAFMTPLPPNAVVYGSGEKAVLMTQVLTVCHCSGRNPPFFGRSLSTIHTRPLYLESHIASCIANALFGSRTLLNPSMRLPAAKCTALKRHSVP